MVKERQSQQGALRTPPPAAHMDVHADADDVPPVTNQIVRELFGKKVAAAKKSPPQPSQPQTAAEAHHDVVFSEAEVQLLRELENEVRRAHDERVHVERVKQEVERERQRMARDRTEFEREMDRARKEIDVMREEEERKLKRDRRVLEKQTKAIMQLPTKKERSEIETLQGAFEEERKDWRAKEVRFKLTVDRLRKQITVRGLLFPLSFSLLVEDMR